MSYIKSKDCVFKPDRTFPTPAAAVDPTGAGITLTIAQLLTEIVEEDLTQAAAWVLPTPALIYAAQGIKIGSWFDFYIINNSTLNATAEILTLTAGVGGVLIGSGIVNPRVSTAGAITTGSSHFRIHMTSATAYNCYRLA